MLRPTAIPTISESRSAVNTDKQLAVFAVALLELVGALKFVWLCRSGERD